MAGASMSKEHAEPFQKDGPSLGRGRRLEGLPNPGKGYGLAVRSYGETDQKSLEFSLNAGAKMVSTE